MKRPGPITIDQPLAPLSGYKTGGTAKYFLETDELAVLQSALLWAQREDLEAFFLGSGTNVLFPDGSLNKLVIRWAQKGIEVNAEKQLVVGAGEELQEVVTFALKHDILNFAWAAGLPGTVGAAVRGNVGAFGQDISEVFIQASYLDLASPLNLQTYTKPEMDFAYRTSTIKTKEHLVLKVWLTNRGGNGSEMEREKQNADKHLGFRQSRHPLQYPNCGSVFKNITDPERVKTLVDHWPAWSEMVDRRWYGKVPAAAIIEATGLKNTSVGGARISDQHANFIINHQGASSQDVMDLIALVQEKVSQRFDVRLEPEIKIING